MNDAFASDITSVSLSQPHHVVLTTSLGSSKGPVVSLIRLSDPDGVQHRRTLKFSTNDFTAIFTSAANPWPGGSTDFAMGASTGVIILDLDRARVGSDWESSVPVKTNSDVLALGFLSPHLLAAGLRNASVLLYDSRSQGSALRLRHNGAVTGLRRADDETRLVVCGLPDALSMYDLRMPRESASLETGNEGKGRRNRQKPMKLPTAPLLRFDYSNKFRYPLGFDVGAEVGLVAAADENGWMQLYSLQSGTRVKSVPDVQRQGEERHQIKCVRFVESPDTGTKIMASVGPRIVELAW